MSRSALVLMSEDHATVKRLLAHLDRARHILERTRLLAQLARELRLHAVVEEEIFYPAFHEAGRRKSDGKLYYEALAEHGAVKILLMDVQDAEPSSLEFAGKAKALKDLIEHHMEEEEREMFPRATSIMGEEELELVGHRMTERRDRLEGGSYRTVDRIVSYVSRSRLAGVPRRVVGSPVAPART